MCETCKTITAVLDWFEGLRVCVQCKSGLEAIRCEHLSRKWHLDWQKFLQQQLQAKKQ